MSTYRGHYLWSIRKKDDDSNVYAYACFASRKACLDWLKMKREEAFFETGSMDYAEEKWGDNNFSFEEVFAIDRQSFIRNFGSDHLGVKWNYDI